MDFTKLLELIENGNFTLEYSSINGKEDLKINGKSILEKEENTFDDTCVLALVKTFKERIDNLDDCTLMECVDRFSNKCDDIKEFNDLFEQDSFTLDEAKTLTDYIELYSLIVKDVLDEKIENLTNIKSMF